PSQFFDEQRVWGLSRRLRCGSCQESGTLLGGVRSRRILLGDLSTTARLHGRLNTSCHQAFDLCKRVVDLDLKKNLAELRSRLGWITAHFAVFVSTSGSQFVFANVLWVYEEHFGRAHDVRVATDLIVGNSQSFCDVFFLLGFRLRVVVINPKRSGAFALP